MNSKLNMDDKIARFDQMLRKTLIKFLVPSQTLSEAIQYSTLNGGKRFRALLVYATGNALDIPDERLHRMAIAIELIHSYSLIHDDLPAMDNARIRRGKKTCHLVFGEAEAILSGDALQMLAISQLVNYENISDRQKLALIDRLTFAAGPAGIVSGQSLDLISEGKPLSLRELETIHRLKTGALIQASIIMPTILACLADWQLDNLSSLADLLGKAYQLQDDILDIETSTEILGKEQAIDQKLNKATYPAILGMRDSKALLEQYRQEINDLLETLSLKQTCLAEIIDAIFVRKF